jgi:hypothetical protein
MKNSSLRPWLGRAPTTRRPAARCQLALTPLEDRTTPTPLLVTGAGPGGPPLVKVFNEDGSLRLQFSAYDSRFAGGVRAAAGDVNGDGVDDVITGAGPGGGPHVEVFDGKTGALLRQWYAFAPNFTGGVFVAGGDVTGDGVQDVITAADAGGGPHVAVWDGRTGALVRQWDAFASNFRGGVRVAAVDVNGDGAADIVTAAGPGGGPHVEVWDGKTGALLRQWYAYAANFRGGVSVAAGRCASNQLAEVVTGAGAGGGPHVKVFDAVSGREVAGFYAYAPSFGGGVQVGLGIGTGRIITAPAVGRADVRTFSATGQLMSQIPAYAPPFGGGAFVGAGADLSAGVITRTYDFGQGDQGWQAGFANYPVDADSEPDFYKLDAGVRPLPTELGTGTGFMIQGDNHSAELFMFLKRRLDVSPDQTYRAQFDVRFGSSAPSNAIGPGAPPGEGVGLEVGAGAAEPVAVPVGGYYRMNVNRELYLTAIGNIANGRAPGQGQQYVSVTRSGAHAFPVRSDEAGNLWLLVATQSGFEALTRLYYQTITVTLTPLTH